MESVKQSVCIAIEEETALAQSRRAAHDLCQTLDLSADATARAELIVVELAGNTLQHAQHGRLFLSSAAAINALQILAIDDGPGIVDVARAVEDGFSTFTTPGLGLGTIKRLATHLDIYSQLGKGTILSALVGEEAGAVPLTDCTAVLTTALGGETLNGDSWFVHPRQDGRHTTSREIYMVVDGLGHGLYASEAASMAVSIAQSSFEADPDLPLDELLNRMHGPMHATRGAAIAFVSVNNAIATWGGVGNISCTLHAPDGSDRSLVSSNGTVGHQMRRVQEFTSPITPGSLLVMHSDGISTKWRFEQYPGLEQKAPATIAGLIYREAVRGRDDATVLVARLNSHEALHA
jgi:anti-sigma regulatory factor (Ser/Thr protein kinase)